MVPDVVLQPSTVIGEPVDVLSAADEVAVAVDASEVAEGARL